MIETRRTCRAFTPKSEENRCLIAKYQTSSCLHVLHTYIHNLYIKLYLSKSKKREPNSKSYTPHVHSLWRSYESRKKNKKIRRDPSLVIWLDIYCPQNKMFVFCCDMYSCHCPPPKSKSRSVFNQNGFNGKNETTHCSNKKSARNSCNLPLQSPHIILLHTFATAETLKYNDR